MDRMLRCLNKTAESANATLSEIGKNVTDVGKTALNKTVEVAKGIGSGADRRIGSVAQKFWVTYHGRYCRNKRKVMT